MPDRGQTETLGFALVFALMISSVILTFTVGYAGLQDIRGVERVNNAERAFEVFADNVEDITLRGAPSRATEVKLAEASLHAEEEIDIRVADPDHGFNQSYSVTPIVFDPDEPGQITFEQGAVIRTRHESGRVVHESTLVTNQNRTILPVVRTRLDSDSKASIGGDGTVLIRTTHGNTKLLHSSDTPDNRVWFNITSPRASEWVSYLDDRDAVDCSVGSGTASCSVTTDRVHITLVRINVEFA